MLTLGYIQENLTLRSLIRIGVHEALVFAQTFIILEKLLNRICLEKTLKLIGKAPLRYTNNSRFYLVLLRV